MALGAALIVAAVSLWATPASAGRFRCAWLEGSCAISSDGGERRIPLATIEGAYVRHSRLRGNSLQLATSSGVQVLSKASLHRVSRREYYDAAAAISELLQHRVDSVDVSFTYRSGLMPGAALAFPGFILLLIGVGWWRASRAA